MRTSVYRFYCQDGNLLYVGITGRGAQRFSEHSRSKWWWDQVAHTEIEHYDTRDEALFRERELIETRHPLYNSIHFKPGPNERRPTLDALFHYLVDDPRAARSDEAWVLAEQIRLGLKRARSEYRDLTAQEKRTLWRRLHKLARIVGVEDRAKRRAIHAENRKRKRTRTRSVDECIVWVPRSWAKEDPSVLGQIRAAGFSPRVSRKHSELAFGPH